MIKILIVDDHIIFREGIKRVLGSVLDIKVAGEAGSGKDALGILAQNRYDVILQALALPDMEGVDLLRCIKNQKPELTRKANPVACVDAADAPSLMIHGALRQQWLMPYWMPNCSSITSSSTLDSA